jgi:hypothetical protein
MAKDPATLFYWNDWNSGTVTLSRYLKGCYMDLLHAQFNSGHLSLDEIKTVLGSDFGSSWPTLQKKFKTDDKGLFFNEKLLNESIKRRSFTKSRRDNLLKTSPHMENENRNRVVNEIINKEVVDIYRAFAHLKLTNIDLEKLLHEGWSMQQIDDILDKIENYKQNTRYTSLLITCRNWLRKDHKPSSVEKKLSALEIVKKIYDEPTSNTGS